MWYSKEAREKMSETTILQGSPVFDFSGVRLCLDFANTLADRLEERPREHLNSYRDLVAWGLQASILTDNEAKLLLEEAARRPGDAEKTFEHAITVREAIFRIFLAIAGDASPDEADLTLLNSVLAEVMGHARIMPKGDHFMWDWASKDGKLDSVLWAAVRSAADVLTSDEIHAVRVCAADDCHWLFLDTSKNHSRRWCDMKTCGNRSKVRRHYERKKQPVK